MSKSKIDALAEPIKKQITDWRREDKTLKSISILLEDNYGIKVSREAIRKYLLKHDIHGLKPIPSSSDKILPESVKAPKPPRGWEAQATITGDTGEVVSPPQDIPIVDDFSDILRFFKINPDEFEVLNDTVQVRTWQNYDQVWLHYYRFSIRKKSSLQDITDILELIKDIKPVSTSNKPVTDEQKYAFVFAAGDLQLGKSDQDGTLGIVTRYRNSLQVAVNKVKELEHLIGPILISWVGDCIEGMVSQGGRNARRTELTTTQQVKLLRLLMTETIKAFAPLTNELYVVSVPGNHDEAQREPVTTDHSDSWAVDALVAVSEALEFNPEAFGHVKCMVVPFDELTTTVTIAGTTITHAHGHQWSRGKHWDWWSGQKWGDHEPGNADILLCGHLHSGVYEQQNFKHMIRTPSFEKESTYFRHRTGLVGNPSAVTFLTRNAKIKYLDFE